MSTVNPSARFENVQVIQSYVMPEANNADSNANAETEGSGFFLTPSSDVPLRSSDVTGFLVTSATEEGKLEYSDPDGFLSLGQLSDVVLTAPVSGQLLNFDGVNWVNATPTLDYLDDVTITAPVAGDVLSYDGTDWVNVPAPAVAAGGADTEVQFNSGGLLAGNAGFVFDSATVTLSVINAAVTGTFDCVSVTATGDVNCVNVVSTGDVGCATVTATGAVTGASFTDGTAVLGPLGALAGVIDFTATGNVSLGAAASTVAVGAAATSLVGLYGVAPVAQAAAVVAPTPPGAAYVQAEAQSMETAINAIIAALQGVGITL